ncbi:MAG TPA: AmmeMemoRadiSam system protein B, partial [Chloroflexota bacterium]
MEARPRLRPLDVFPVEHDGRRLFGLRDRLDPSSPVLLLTPEALFLASLMDGERTIPALRAAFMVRTGQTITEGQVTELVEQLEAAHFLDGERYREHLARLREAFARAPVRPAIHAGKAYPGTPEEFRQSMETWSRAANGPRSLAGGRESVPLAGLLAPHIDFHRGGPGYAWACHAMSVASPADLYVVLGTCHAPMALPFASTSKPYDTPFGPTTTAPAFLEHLARRWEADLFADEYAHRGEHSGEFAATWLRYLMAEGAVPETPIVTILCGALHHLVPEGSSPRDVALVEGFVQALGEAIAAW